MDISPAVVLDRPLCECLGPVGVSASGDIIDVDDGIETGWLVFVDVPHCPYYYVDRDGYFYIAARSYKSLSIDINQEAITKELADLIMAAITDYIKSLDRPNGN